MFKLDLEHPVNHNTKLINKCTYVDARTFEKE